MVSRPITILFLFLLIPFTSVFGQLRVKGVISDSAGAPIAFVQVVLYEESSNKFISFVQSDRFGKYTIQIKEPGSYLVVFNALSYKRKSYPMTLNIQHADSILILNPKLSSEPLKLNEVIVRSERSITVRGDTISYKVTDFKTGSEEVVEDLLKKLPGFEVDANGRIRFLGKEIEKVKVENSDLFGKGYGIITKNLDAGLIEEVEVLKHYTDSPELKGLEYSDKVAINLILTKDAKLSFFGNATLGYNTQKNHEARFALIALGKEKLSQYAFLNSNELGYDPLGGLSQFVDYQKANENEFGLMEKPAPFLKLKKPSIQLNDRRVRSNNSNMASYNVIYKPNEELELKGISMGLFERDRYYTETSYVYDLKNVISYDSESYALTSRLKNGFAKFEIDFLPDPNTRLNFSGFTVLEYERGEANSVYNRENLSEYLGMSGFEVFQKFDYTTRFHRDNAIKLSANYSFLEISEKLDASFLLPEDFFGMDYQSNSGVQRKWLSMEWVSFSGRLISKTSRNLSVEPWAEVAMNKFFNSSNLMINGIGSSPRLVGDPFANDFELNLRSLTAGISGRFSKSESFTVYSSIDLNYLLYDFNQIDFGAKRHDDIVNIQPRVGFDWKIDPKNKISSSYHFTTLGMSISDMMSGYVFRGDKTFERGLGKFATFKGHNIFLNYTHGGFLNRFFVNAFFLFNKKDNSLINDVQLSPGYNLLGKVLSKGQYLYMVGLSSDIYIRSLRNNMKLTTTFSSSDSRSRINGLPYSFNSTYSRIGVEFRSVFDGVFNYTFGSSYTSRSALMEDKYTFTHQLQFFDIYLDLSDGVDVQIIGERYGFNKSGLNDIYYFVDGLIKFDLKPNQSHLTFEIRNLLNTKTFRSYALSDYQSHTSLHQIVPRYFLLSLQYRF